jgi:hypothetical protein
MWKTRVLLELQRETKRTANRHTATGQKYDHFEKFPRYYFSFVLILTGVACFYFFVGLDYLTGARLTVAPAHRREIVRRSSSKTYNSSFDYSL